MRKRREELAQQRKTLGMTQEQLAERLGVSVQTIARLEQGQTEEPLANLRLGLIRELRLSPFELDRMLRNDGQVTAPSGQAILARLSWFATLEQGARLVLAWQPFTVHALLQTRAYATAVERADPVPIPDSEVIQKVELRLARQGIVTRESDPVELSVILDESVFHRVTGGREVMAAQLEHLTDMLQLSNVELRVLSLGAGLHAAAFGSFTVFGFPDGRRMVCIEERTGFHYLDRIDAVEAHEALFDHLRNEALPPAESADLIRHIAKEKYQP